jgi:hypothetical protein
MSTSAKALSLTALLALTATALLSPIAFSDTPFNDISDDHLYAEAITYVYDEGIVEGYSDGTYRSSDLMNRAEFTKIIIEATHESTEIDSCDTTANTRSDLITTEWYAKYICTALSNDVLDGYDDGTFKPENTINFAEASKITANAFDLDLGGQAREWYEPYVVAMDRLYAIPLEVDSFETELTRGQFAEIVYRLRAGITDRSTQTYGSLDGVAEPLMQDGDDNTSSTSDDDDNSSDDDDADETLASTNDCPTDRFLSVTADSNNDDYVDPSLEVTCDDDYIYITSNNIPNFEFNQMTPNDLEAQEYSWKIPLNPEVQSSTDDVPLVGGAAVTVGGLVIFGPTESPQDGSRDPYLDGLLDFCNGHTAQAGAYHHHARPDCLFDSIEQEDLIMAYAYDGFPIYAPYICEDGDCSNLTKVESSYELIDDEYGDTIEASWDAHEYVEGAGDLDECNGLYDADGNYGYYATDSFPYFMGCYRGDVEDDNYDVLR